MSTGTSKRALGIDIGSTTVKVVLTQGDRILYEKYERHLSQVREKALELIREIEPLLREGDFTAAVSGSAGMGVAEAAELPFVQEVYATGEVVRQYEPPSSSSLAARTPRSFSSTAARTSA